MPQQAREARQLRINANLSLGHSMELQWFSLVFVFVATGKA